MISDFGVFITICSLTALDAWAGVKTPKLLVPDQFKPTWEGRGWLISPFNNPWWVPIAAVAPAILATILIFMDQQITAVIVNRRENKLNVRDSRHILEPRSFMSLSFAERMRLSLGFMRTCHTHHYQILPWPTVVCGSNCAFY